VDKGDLPSHPFRDQAAEVWGAPASWMEMEFSKVLGGPPAARRRDRILWQVLISSPTTTHYLTGRDTESAADHL
jgi:hypothetical protein